VGGGGGGDGLVGGWDWTSVLLLHAAVPSVVMMNTTKADPILFRGLIMASSPALVVADCSFHYRSRDCSVAHDRANAATPIGLLLVRRARLSARRQHEGRLSFVEPTLQTDRISMRVHEPLDPRVEPRQLTARPLLSR
jgi:hypothetical protein